MSKKKATAISLPLSRTSKIMSSAVGVESVSQDIVALATKATEIFLTDFVRRAYDQAGEEDEDEFRSNVLEYNDLQTLVHTDQRYEFLIDAVPKRVKFNEALQLYHESKRREELRLEEQAQRQQEAEAEAAQEVVNRTATQKENNHNDDDGPQQRSNKESPSKSSSSSLNNTNNINNDHDNNQSTIGTPTASSTAPTTPDVYSDP